MTTQTENQPKQVPAFVIYDQDEQGEMLRIGVAFRHKRGHGLNVLIDDKRYLAFPPKAK